MIRLLENYILLVIYGIRVLCLYNLMNVDEWGL
jgi:hypothetical protein